MKYQFPILIIISVLFLFGCHTEQTTPVTIDVALHVKDNNHTSPLQVVIENKTANASSYQWTFEGGEPSSSSKRHPEPVVFTAAGEHKITLEAWNDGDRTSQTYTVRVDNAVMLNFEAKADINNYAPAIFNITNQSVGGNNYQWTFEGGDPATFSGQNPPAITYNLPGIYSIKLVAENGSLTFSTEQTITVKEAMEASFTIVPSFEDEDDMEAPLRATFNSKLKGVETILWECEGATITNKTSKDASIYFPSAGKYMVYLNVSNGKETQRLLQEITVKANTNLRTHRNIKLGINSAQYVIAPYYSTKLRQSFTSKDLNADNGKLIDIVYFGLNPEFTFNRFVSPNRVSETALATIPNASYTKFINRQEVGTTLLTVSQFESMADDTLLRSLPLANINYGDEYFTNSLLPRVVMFETGDGRKGAILIKEMVTNGKNGSYITVDIKVQKND